MSRIYKTEAIVCSYIKLGEADRIISLYSPSGSIRAVAKGARNVKSRFGARLEPLSHVDLVINKGKSLDVISSAELISANAGLREDWALFTAASAAAGLVDKLGQAESHPGELYDLFLRFLEVLERKPQEPLLLLAALELRAIKRFGALPDLFSCAGCRENITAGAWTDLSQGGSYCSFCSNRPAGSVYLPPAARSLFLLLLAATADQVAVMLPEKETLAQLRAFIEAYLMIGLDLKLNAYRLL